MSLLSMKIVLCSYVLLCLVSNVLCIKCWSCKSSNDPKCADPFDNSTIPITDCSLRNGMEHLTGQPSVCRKISQKVNGEWQYTRDCAYLSEVGIQGDERFCLTRTGTDNIFEEHCTCNNKDGCNSSVLTMPMSVLTTFLISLVVVIFKMTVYVN